MPASLLLQSYPQSDCLWCESSFDLALGVVVVASLRSISRWLLLRRNKSVQAFSFLVVEKEACGIRASQVGGIARRFGHHLTSEADG